MKKIASSLKKYLNQQSLGQSAIREKLVKSNILVILEVVSDILKNSGKFPELYALEGYLTFTLYSFALRKEWNWTERVDGQTK